MKLINHIFLLTVRNGAIDELLFNNMRNFLPKEYLQKKVKTEKDVSKLTVRDLPAEWTKNATLISRDRKISRNHNHKRR